jgi:hypothetical protein
MSGRVTPPAPGAPADRVPAAAGETAPAPPAAAVANDIFAGQKPRRAIFTVIRPDVVRPARHAAVEAGADATKTNTFGVRTPATAYPERGKASWSPPPWRRS